jgi:hypothetical protein
LPKIKQDSEYSLMFWCPGCEFHHAYYIKQPPGPEVPIWTFNGDFEKPTLRASLRNTNPRTGHCCHLFITDGVIEYCSDCTHSLAGQKVPLREEP